MVDHHVDEPAPRTDPNYRFRAKRHNEQLKALYGFMNALAAAVIITVTIAPSILGTAIASQVDQPGWVLIGSHYMG